MWLLPDCFAFQLPVFLFPYAFFGKCAPLDAAGTEKPRGGLTAKFTSHVCLVTPDLYLFAAMTTEYIFRFWLFYLTASGAACLEHVFFP